MMLEPFFFDAGGRRLFGAYHPPSKAIAAPMGVVLCQPIGQEGLRAHRAFFVMAELLSSEGHHVLRFDHYGCGDSEGNFEDGGLDIWRNDIECAIEELRAGSSAQSISLVGLRVGANLAWSVAETRRDVDKLVIWSPITNGRAYLEELGRAHRVALKEGLVKGADSVEHSEALGFPLSAALRRALENLEFRGRGDRPAAHTLVLHDANDHVAPSDDPETAPTGPRIPPSEVWLKAGRRVPMDSLRGVTSWLCE
jgi:exosortase A-associated hydrolase 2